MLKCYSDINSPRNVITPLFWIVSVMMFFMGLSQVRGQSFEIGGGIGHRFHLDGDKDIFEPAIGYEVRILRNQLFRYSADEENIGFSLGLYRFTGNNNKSIMDGLAENQLIDRQVIETKLSYRYDHFLGDNVSLFWGGDVGFQFVYYNFNPALQNGGGVAAAIYTRAILSPAAGINYEFNEYVALYYRLEYGLAFDVGKQPNWGDSFTKLNHLVTNSTGIRLRF
ncbi:hypothetical protein [Negadavirga shengliensis]|uniref:Outer membrane protein beta-barrel domain-containing protein n=1 Tax=Negadavirga shengliensis TaxID=1389218 RepID=A0ABV9T028_9BACT